MMTLWTPATREEVGLLLTESLLLTTEGTSGQVLPKYLELGQPFYLEIYACHGQMNYSCQLN